MTADQIILLSLLGVIFVLLIWERWRYDVVAVGALAVGATLGVVAPRDAFQGFGHPATVTVAAVLIISRALSNTGAVDFVTNYVKLALRSPSLHIAVLSGLGAILSTVMNNVGALALLMPVAIQTSEEAKRSPAIVLMPLAFGTILGGMVTLIGTPPNIIVASYRHDIAGSAFKMFDFSPVGAVVASLGLVFVTVIGWRLIPEARRKHSAPKELFQIKDYITEVRVTKDSKAIGQSLTELEKITENTEALIVGLIRGDQSIRGAVWREGIQEGDILVIEAGPQGIKKFVETLKLELAGTQPKEEVEENGEAKSVIPKDQVLMEAVIPPNRSWLVGRMADTLQLRSRFGIMLLAVSRQGKPYRGRLKSFRFRAGDVLLLQGEKEQVVEVISSLGCLPLAERGIKIRETSQAWLSSALFVLAIVSATLGLLALPVALLLAAVLMVMMNMVPPRDIYDSVDWPVIVLIGAMIPIGNALEVSGATAIIAESLVSVTTGLPPVAILAMILVLTMTLSDIMNNAATAVVMAPLAWALAQELGVNPDPFLMAVAIGASCAFLTPIGHQNNLLVMGPGGYRFGDYWRMGLPLEILIVIVSIPTLLWAWPL
ncbi:MAG: SLC13 family permease [Nitrospirales bacterium]|nr:SLC13 family permease [Nitrospira sp.]MDR4500822.1 SLC13 family permease [Nitrospirales bacterium]